MVEKTIQVSAELLGKTQQFSCTPGQQGELLAAIELLNSRVNEMRSRSTVRNEHNALLMAALHLCHEVNDLNKKSEHTQNRLQLLHEKLSSQSD